MEIKHGREVSRQSNLAISFDDEQRPNRIPISNCPSSSSSSDSSPDLELCELDTPNNSQPVFLSQGPVTSLSRVPSKTSVACKRSGLLFQPPPFQIMDPAGNYDSNRIPSAIFASRPMTPVEWSLASNESLFSIRTGNSSFSMRHLSQASICKSPELTKFEVLIMNFPPSQFPLTGTAYSARESVSIDRRSDVIESSQDTPKVVLNGARNEHVNNENQQSEYAVVEEGKNGVIEGKILTSEDAVVEEGKADVIEGKIFTSEDVICAALPDSDLSFSIPNSAFQGQRDGEETESGKMEEVKAKREVQKNSAETAAPYATTNINAQCIWFFSCCRLCD